MVWMRRIVSVFIVPTVLLSLAACAKDSSPTSSSTDAKQLIKDLNAFENDNRTIRFKDMPIKVYVDGPSSWKDDVKKWEEWSGGAIRFEFVNSDPEVGIRLKNGIQQPLVCGVTYEPKWDNGEIRKADIEMDLTSYTPLCKQTVAHEAGHALGILGHTKNGGLMDGDGGDGKMRDEVKEMMRILYSNPPNTSVDKL